MKRLLNGFLVRLFCLALIFTSTVLVSDNTCSAATREYNIVENELGNLGLNPNMLNYLEPEQINYLSELLNNNQYSMFVSIITELLMGAVVNTLAPSGTTIVPAKEGGYDGEEEDDPRKN